MRYLVVVVGLSLALGGCSLRFTDPDCPLLVALGLEDGPCELVRVGGGTDE